MSPRLWRDHASPRLAVTSCECCKFSPFYADLSATKHGMGILQDLLWNENSSAELIRSGAGEVANRQFSEDLPEYRLLSEFYERGFVLASSSEGELSRSTGGWGMVGEVPWGDRTPRIQTDLSCDQSQYQHNLYTWASLRGYEIQSRK